MRIRKKLFSLVFILVLFFSLTGYIYATDETESMATGYVTVTAKVPPDFTYSISLDLEHRDSGASYTIIVDAEGGYTVKEAVQSGVYITLVDIVTGGDQVYCPTCEGGKNHTLAYPAYLVVEGGRNNPFEIEIIESGNKQENLDPAEGTEGVAKPVGQQKGTGKSIEENEEDEKKRFTEKLLEYAQGDNPDAFEQRESMGKRLLKKNFLTLIMLFVLCAVSIYIELGRRL